jgi:glycosyltransferase involved in cell wall biosynthesis
MRVLIFSLSYYPRFIGGAEVAIREITDRVGGDEVEFHMITLRYDSDLASVEQIGNVLVHRIGPTVRAPDIADLSRPRLHIAKYIYQFLAAATAIRLHRKYRYDLSWAVMAHAAGVPAALFKMRFRKVKYLLTLQEGQPPEYVERLARPLWPLFKRAFTSADHVQAISTFLLHWAQRMGFKGIAEVIPNGVDSKRFAIVAGGTAPALRARREGEVFLVTTSRLAHKNAVDDVIRAIPAMPANVTFLIAGIGAEEQMLRALTADLRVEDRVRFLGEVSHEHLPALLSACDIFIRPSRSEGQGISFIEAMAAGLPVIATQEGGIADFLFDEQRNPDRPTTGWAVDRDSPEQIASAVKDVLANPTKVEAVIRTARDMVVSKYEWSTIAREMRALFLRLA